MGAWRARPATVGILLTFGIVAATASCKPRQGTPNDAYLDPRISAETWDRLFRAEGRELYDRRELVMSMVAVRPGMAVADVGAGTGLFTMILSDAVGPQGRVYAEEVIDRFSHYVAERAVREGRANVVSVVGTEHSVGLPPESIDLAFLCDVYHHFAFPAEMLASIRTALRSDGQVFLVEFRREPGQSAPWVFEHVRANEGTVLREFVAAGFVAGSRDDRLRDSYVWTFRRASRAKLPEAARPAASEARDAL